MQADQENLKFQLIIPINQAPSSLSTLSNNPEARLLLGYRNIIFRTEDKWEWGLIKDSKTCGKAFIFEITEQQAHNIQQIKQQNEVIQIVGNSYILLRNEKQLPKETAQIKKEQLVQLLQKIGGNTKININIVKNAFNGLTQYQQRVEKAVSEIKTEDSQLSISVADKVKLEFRAKSLAGSSLFEIPSISKETGNPIEGEKLTIKIS